MQSHSIMEMPFSRIYPLLEQKAVKKGRTREEVALVTCWLTGYSREDLARLSSSAISYGDFFSQAPHPNPDRLRIRGSVCGVRVESVEDPLLREIRYLDKLVDDLAKGKPLERILAPGLH